MIERTPLAGAFAHTHRRTPAEPWDTYEVVAPADAPEPGADEDDGFNRWGTGPEPVLPRKPQ